MQCVPSQLSPALCTLQRAASELAAVEAERDADVSTDGSVLCSPSLCTLQRAASELAAVETERDEMRALMGMKSV